MATQHSAESLRASLDAAHDTARTNLTDADSILDMLCRALPDTLAGEPEYTAAVIAARRAITRARDAIDAVELELRTSEAA